MAGRAKSTQLLMIIGVGLGACASVQDLPAKNGDGQAVPAVGRAGPVLEAPTIRLEDYRGQSRQRLEGLLGLPALTRSEGGNGEGGGNFLRFDMGDCRIWAVTRYQEGEEIVATIRLGPSRQGDPVPDLDQCLQTQG